MGDILDDIFGGSFRTPGVKASEDILLAKTITPALAFEELENIRKSPTLFMLFYTDARDRKVLENLHFILEVEEFVALPIDFRTVREREIIEKYLTTGAVYEINIPDNQRKVVAEKVGTKCDDIFSDSQKYITHMLIRNVDSTWSYKKAPPPPPKKELTGKSVKKAVDKVTDDERMRDLIYYFLVRRITPLMYQARTSLVSLQRKVRTCAPVGYASIKIKQATGISIKTAITLYIEGRCYYKNTAGGIIRDKKSQVKTSPKKGMNDWNWGNEILKFDVKDLDTQVIEFNIWEKRFLPDTAIAYFIIDLIEIVPKHDEEFIEELKITLEEGLGELLLDFHYEPNKEELLRQQQEKEKQQQANRSTSVSPEFDFLMS